ncbi:MULTISPECIES: DUF2326 domain-containing protein [Phytobacter]|uniref:DUF2326 domain-containing protein n=1 Tax=Phytobacter diazotrophicus TaxID=395631 RepID=A0ABM7W158_9ENTR|nr:MULTISPECIES: DUF2326 domain-containing protein [Phytobacter]BBE79913.1 hypothetical protein MRY16398_49690 [Phytobacter sp. MRY16-398]BDD53292.1 hypothetical protein PDTA9734_47790 [Phytobacter diazotrophicus]BEG84220.1 DUF2326 domain-containing protein [Phytobacter diazotrophicus]BEG90119.1 DUF2326 domain-containing protein [Phytobacter diazotrophicus]BEG95882.1 DUF2326 domain-containing protein [Phytobacter diazotrophicus]
MIRINKLYSEPFSFEPIEFKKGINLILGEKDKSSNKTNGVGKSLLIEFINFGLMKDYSRSRLSKIPDTVFPEKTYICLDFFINKNHIISKRSISEESTPTLFINGIKKSFTSIDDANNFLTILMFEDNKTLPHPTFRSMLGPLIRDERSEFKSIIDCFDTKARIPPDFAPHLFFFGISIDLYKKIKEINKSISELSIAKRKIKDDIESISGKKISNARAEVNDLDYQVKIIKQEMELLEGDKTFDFIRDEVIIHEDNLDSLRNKKAILKSELNKIQALVGDNYIDENEVIELYNKLKSGLGDNIGKELSDVLGFKRKIDNFQRVLIDARKDSILSDLEKVEASIYEVSVKLSSKTAIIKQNGHLRNIKTLFLAYEKKLEELSQLSSFIKKYDDYESKAKAKKAERAARVVELDIDISHQESTISEFTDTVSAIHDYVMENRKCSFSISANEKSSVVDFDLRIFDDGSHSNEREKVFIYDMSLLLTHGIFIRHPKLLIHDNIFDVDRDTLIKSLNYISSKSSCLEDAQYILTLNIDKLNEIGKDELKLDIEEYRRVTLTKSHRFLGRQYQEK